MTDIVDELRWRGLIALSTDEDALRKAFADGPVTFYCGFDPTAPSLHLGNLVQILTMRRIQQAGNLPLGLVGGATGLIGDPKPTAERVLNDPETVAGWVERLRGQVSRFLDFEGPYAARMVNNLDWTSGMSAISLLRDVGKYFRVNNMIAKEAVARRLNSDAGISYTEFSYQILQGMDYLELNRRYGCTLQTGGSDQWGNLTAGTDLIRKADGKSVHALATPLIVKADGTKFGKTESGTVWLDPELTTPYAFYQFWLNADDRDVSNFLRIFSFRSKEEIEELERETAERPAARLAQRALAEELTTLVHGAEQYERAVAASKALFGQGDLADLEAPTLAAALAEVPKAEVTELQPVVDLLVAVGLAPSRSAARRTIKEGGAYLNNVKVTDEEAVPTEADLLHGRWLVLRRGKRNLAAAELVPAAG
ncbi:tyrosine--tRNA ligase [Kitasatospora aureofaciens]|uniref:Tyrosine--tRNA ligase n=1 Tax=Kitasatospora aureofaciens TaxID=1894 RepID=A0A1E7N0P1_KITAU|nr:tyrosine--tRNA ligase [Kitasatospora aureofaciens]ARF82602.1 tyrosine--tRNA ligase [Kitasatospora aureofaciens]OEV34258.1 tyrosine--tRNA ligase [Kitasatospora aureofaciens]QEV03838.1 tyrosine--tRNA ligase [Streptomyces viridifaciens]UKZ05422.1 tyrosine--tRNA ligase [Streptomyces viridifaciens]